MNPVLRCDQVTVRYGDTAAVDGVDLAVAPGETTALLGPSGSGKTTLLYAIAGFVPIDAGSIEIGGQPVAGAGAWLPPEQRDVAVVFQNYALWPHMDAITTVAYPLRRAGLGRDAAAARAGELLDLVGIGDLAHRRPAELSGGQQQRVGLARAMARRARIALYDEPTAHLDAALRNDIQREIAALRAEMGMAALYATHDAQEALAIADRVVLLRQGRVVQSGPPSEVYERPADLWAAQLTGDASVLDADVAADGAVRVGEHAIRPDGVGAPGKARLLVRPEWGRLGGPLPGEVVDVRYRGAHTDHSLATPAGEVVIRHPGSPRHRPGDHVTWELLRVWRLP